MNKKIFVLKFFFLFSFSYSFAVFAEEVSAVKEVVDEVIVKQKKAETETAIQARESQAIIEQTMATEADAKAASSGDPAQEKTKAWIPLAIDYDWIQLTSNEWLKGEIQAMYRDSLEFDSDKLNLLEVEWEDVKILRSYRANSVSIDGYGTIYGVLEVTDQIVRITNEYETKIFDRPRLISFAPGGEEESDLWSIKLTLSLDFKQGNTDQLDYTAKANVKRRASRTRFTLDYIGTVSKTDGGGERGLFETINNHRLSANFDYYKTRYFFYNPVFAELFRDPFLNIRLRTLVGAGLGYTLIDDGRTELSFSGGPAFVKTTFVSVAVGEEISESTPAFVLRTNYDTELTSTLDFIAKYNMQYADDASGGYTHHAIMTLESKLTGKLDLDISLIWDRVSKPTLDADGNVPVPDDYRIMVGITYTY